jgi:hypothetical protein
LDVFPGFVERPNGVFSESVSASTPVARAREKERKRVAEKYIVAGETYKKVYRRNLRSVSKSEQN